MNPKEAPQFKGIVKLLLHFRWTWIGLIAPDNDGGDQFVKTMKAEVSGSAICVAFTYAIPRIFSVEMNVPKDMLLSCVAHLTQRKANVIIYYGDSESMFLMPHGLKEVERQSNVTVGKVWISTALWGFTLTTSFSYWDMTFFHGALSFVFQTDKRIKSQKLFLTEDWDFLDSVWPDIFECSHTHHRWSRKTWERCMRRENLPKGGMVMSAESYNIYNAVYVVAHALHALITPVSHHMMTAEEGILGLLSVEPWQVRVGEIH